MRKRPATASRSVRNSRRTILRSWFWSVSSTPSRSILCFSSRKSGLAWYDSSSKTLALVVGVQSPYAAAESVAFLLGEAEAAFRPTHIDMNFASCGGGFGGREHTPFPLYLALAAMAFPGRPVRLTNNRLDQFQSGIKRHAFKMKTRIGVDRATGKIVGFAADHALDGGGLANFSASVATVAATAALGVYYAPKLTSRRLHSIRAASPRDRCAAMGPCRP